MIFEYGRGTSCDLGISVGEEWVFFGEKINGKIAVAACDRNVRYRRADGLREWQFELAARNLGKLKELYKHPVSDNKNGKFIEYYPNGQKEIEVSYSGGKLDGERKIWYPDGVLLSRQVYTDGILNRKSEWYFSSGNVSEIGYYDQGKPYNIKRVYFDPALTLFLSKNYVDSLSSSDSLQLKSKRSQVQFETVYDTMGRVVFVRWYNPFGNIDRETIICPETESRTEIKYHRNGTVASIGYSLKGRSVGRYQAYDEDGISGKAWEHDEEGKRIKID